MGGRALIGEGVACSLPAPFHHHPTQPGFSTISIDLVGIRAVLSYRRPIPLISNGLRANWIQLPGRYRVRWTPPGGLGGGARCAYGWIS